MPRRRTTKVKSVTFARITGHAITDRLDPEYLTALGIEADDESFHPVEPDMLRYDLAFVCPDDPTLVAFPTFSNGYGGKVTRGRWSSFQQYPHTVHGDTRVGEGEVDASLPRMEVWNRTDLWERVEAFKAGRGDWFTYRYDSDAGKLRRVPLKAFIGAHPDTCPNEVAREHWDREAYFAR